MVELSAERHFLFTSITTKSLRLSWKYSFWKRKVESWCIPAPLLFHPESVVPSLGFSVIWFYPSHFNQTKMEKHVLLCFRFQRRGRRWTFELGESEWLTTSISNSCVKALTSRLLENVFYWLQSTLKRCAIQGCVSSLAAYQLMAVTSGESSSFNLIKRVAYNVISFVGMSECILSTEKRTTPYLNTYTKACQPPCSFWLAIFCFLIEFTLLKSDQ